MTTETGDIRAMRAYRFTLDPTAEQLEALGRHAGTARWAFNHALAAKVEAHVRWRTAVEALVADGVEEAVARKQIKVPIPNKMAIQKALNAVKGDSRTGVEGACDWWHEVSTYAFQSAFDNADQAWKNWLSSLAGKRAGRKVGYPRFKKKGRSRDSVRIHHDVKRPTIRLDGYRRLIVPRLGSIRLHDNSRRLARAIKRGAFISSVTLSRGGDRWYAAVLVSEPPFARPVTRRQKDAGTIGVDLGLNSLAALSTVDGSHSEMVDNPRHLRASTRRLVKAQRALSRTTKGSTRRVKAARRVGRLHHLLSERRAGNLHALSKRLTTGWAAVAMEDLAVLNMTASARGTAEAPGRKVRQKAGLNKALLDASFGELRRQVTYKSGWYGSELRLVDRFYPSSKTCSNCGTRKPSLSLAERTYTCESCGFTLDRDLNAARNIAREAIPVASGAGETKNARGDRVSPEGASAPFGSDR